MRKKVQKEGKLASIGKKDSKENGKNGVKVKDKQGKKGRTFKEEEGIMGELLEKEGPKE